MKTCIKVNYKGNIIEYSVDESTFKYLNQFKWYYRCGYASRKRTKEDIPGGNHVHLHREVLRLNNISIPNGLCVDHINRDKTDNTLKNLRVVTRSINSRNISKESYELRVKLAHRLPAIASKLPRTKKQIDNSKIAVRKMNKSGANKHLGENNYQARKVLDKSTGIVYNTIREAAVATNLVYSTLKNRLNGNLSNTTTLIKLEDRS